VVSWFFKPCPEVSGFRGNYWEAAEAKKRHDGACLSKRIWAKHKAMSQPTRRAPLDYLWLYGLPVAFVLVAWFGVMRLLPPDHRSPLQLLHDGAIAVGDDQTKVEQVLHRAPSFIETRAGGGITLVYRRTIYDNDLAMEDARVDLSASGKVEAIRYDRTSPPTPSSPGS
jgi:hypothetical protein